MATLTVTIKEELTLNERVRGSENVLSISGVTQVDERLATIGTTEVPIAKFGAAVDAGQFKDGTVEYLRITNLDASNTVTLRVSGNSEEYFVKLEAGASYILTNNSMDANATGAQTVSLANIDEIKAVGSAAGTDIEIFVATNNS